MQTGVARQATVNDRVRYAGTATDAQCAPAADSGERRKTAAFTPTKRYPGILRALAELSHQLQGDGNVWRFGPEPAKGAKVENVALLQDRNRRVLPFSASRSENFPFVRLFSGHRVGSPPEIKLKAY
jgi:hypothetical protein